MMNLFWSDTYYGADLFQSDNDIRFKTVNNELEFVGYVSNLKSNLIRVSQPAFKVRRSLIPYVGTRTIVIVCRSTVHVAQRSLFSVRLSPFVDHPLFFAVCWSATAVLCLSFVEISVSVSPYVDRFVLFILHCTLVTVRYIYWYSLTLFTSTCSSHNSILKRGLEL